MLGGIAQIRTAAVEALALLQHVTREDDDVIELLKANSVPRDEVSAVMNRMLAVSQPLPLINTTGLLELWYESSVSTSSAADGDGFAAGPMSPSSPVIHTAAKDAASFWSEESTEMSLGPARRAPRCAHCVGVCVCVCVCVLCAVCVCMCVCGRVVVFVFCMSVCVTWHPHNRSL